MKKIKLPKINLPKFKLPKIKLPKYEQKVAVDILAFAIILALVTFSQYSKKTAVKPEPTTPTEVAQETQPEENTEVAPAEEEKKEPPRAALVIGLVSDAHSGANKGFGGLNSAAWSIKKYAEPDAMVSLGDLIESRKSGKYSKGDAQADLKAARGRLYGNFATFLAIGNHEVLSMSKDDVRAITGRGNYFSANVKGYNLIILDTNFNSSGDNIDSKHDDTFIYNGRLSDSEIGWLEGQLSANGKNIIFSHHPLYELDNENKVEKIVSKNKSRIVFIANGHIHPSTIRQSVFGGVPAYTIPAAMNGGGHAVARVNGMRAVVTRN